MSITPRRVLITTAPPNVFGGVASKGRLLAAHLAARGHAVTVAHYVPLSAADGLNARLPATLWGAAPRRCRYVEWGGIPFVAIGCRWPEIESNYYSDSPLWRDLVSEHDRHIAVGGTVLPAAPLAAAAVPHLAWAATGVSADRRDRMRAMGTARRLFEEVVVRPRLLEIEQRVLRGPIHILGVSRHSLDEIVRPSVGRIASTRLPVPVDPQRFHPAGRPSQAGVVGCAGRFTDPRKNLPMLLDAIAILRRRGAPARLLLAGDAPNNLLAMAAARGIGEAVEFRGRMSDEQLPEFYREIDVFALPSLQEGLAIVGIEAIASGVPVVSTRCGGPEDYVRDDVTGYLADFSAEAMANAIARIVDDRELRARLSADARALAVEEFGFDMFARRLADAWQATWPEDRGGP